MRRDLAARLLIPVLVGALTLSALPLSARTPEEEELHYRVIVTKDLRLLYYDEAHSFITPHVARCFENAFSFHKNLFGYEPSEAVDRKSVV